MSSYKQPSINPENLNEQVEIVLLNSNHYRKIGKVIECYFDTVNNSEMVTVEFSNYPYHVSFKKSWVKFIEVQNV